MITKDKIRDYAFVAYLVTKGYVCSKNDDGSFYCDIEGDDLNRVFDDYRKNYKPIIDKIRKMLKNM
jgi:hypothetical protein